jgi:YesN/AraC family two-component response regulator
MRNDIRDSFIPHPSFLIPDLILSDLMMPVMDGYQLLEKLKGDDATRHIPVIMLTARAEAKDKLKALRIGVDDYLTKPFDEEELLVRIDNLLANQGVRKKAAAEEPPGADAPDMSQPDQEWLENFEAYIRDNISDDALTITFLAQEFAMSESTLFRQVTRLTGLSPKQYLLEVRLDTARQMLENRVHRTVAWVAAKAGFSNARTFTRNFKERFGKLPGEYLSN